MTYHLQHFVSSFAVPSFSMIPLRGWFHVTETMFQYSIHAAKILKRFNLYDENVNSMNVYTAKKLAESNEVCPPTILALPNNKIV